MWPRMEIRHSFCSAFEGVGLHHDSQISDSLVYFGALKTCGVDR